jgi:hypothetical protein
VPREQPNISQSPLRFLHLDNRFYFAMVLILTTAVIADTTIIKLYTFNRSELLSTWRITLFIIIAVSFFITIFSIMTFINRKIIPSIIVQKRQIKLVMKLTIVIQIALLLLLIFVILQLTTFSYYFSMTILIASTMSHILAVFVMIALTKQFFNWYKSKKNVTILLYSVAVLTLTSNLIFGIVSVDLVLLSKPLKIYPHVAVFVPYVPRGSLLSILNDAYSITTIGGFVATWIATASLLYHYSYKIGKSKYWILLVLPLIYFSSQFLTSFINVFELVMYNLTFFGSFFSVFFLLSKTCGGILFGIGFLTLYRIIQDKMVKSYMLLSSTGLILFFAANQATTVIASPSYPPFGIVSISSIGLASFLMFIGIYSSAISISQDSKLRRNIVQNARNELKLLYNIGSSEMEDKVWSKTLVIMKKQQETMAHDSGVESSLTEEDVRVYVKKVIKELGSNIK